MITSLTELTPIEELNGIWYKRDDYFVPFSDIKISGGKVRQCLSLIEANLEHIKENCNSIVGTISSVHSPQGIIVARTAKEFGLKSILAIGNNKTLSEVLKAHRNLEIASELGCDIRLVTKVPYTSVLHHELKKMPEKNMFYILFGMNVSDNPNKAREALIKPNADQVENLPEDLEHLVITVGSGISASGILSGIDIFNKKIKNIHLVQISGFDKRKTIWSSWLGFWPRPKIKYYDDVIHYPYDKWLEVDCGFEMDGRYEAKVWKWMVENIDYKNEKTLFWIIGNSKVE